MRRGLSSSPAHRHVLLGTEESRFVPMAVPGVEVPAEPRLPSRTNP